MLSKSSMSLTVRVNSLAGELCSITAHDSWKIIDVKHAVENIARIQVGQQRIIANIAILQDQEMLSTLRAHVCSGVLDLTLIRRSEEAVEWLNKVRRARHYNVFREAPEHIKEDREIALEAARKNGNCLDFMSAQFQEDHEIVLAAVQQDANIFSTLQAHHQADREIAMAAVHQDGRQLKCAASQLRSDREVVLCAVKNAGRALLHAAPECWDHEVVLEAVSSVGRVLPNSSTPMLDRAAARELWKNPQIQQICGDRDFILLAVERDPAYLQFASDALRADREVVMRALDYDACALQYAASTLQADREIVTKAVLKNPAALEFAAQVLKDDRALVIMAVEKNGMAYKFASPELQKDEEVLVVAMRTNCPGALLGAAGKFWKPLTS